MQIDGPGAQLTATWETKFRFSAPGHDGPQKNNGRTHFPHEIRGDLEASHGIIHHQAVSLPVAPAAQMFQNLHRRVHIGEMGAIM